MVSITKLLNFALPPLSLILLSILTLPLLLWKQLMYVKKMVYTENVANKVVLITGAASGIGQQLAYEYARRGAKLSLVDIRKEKLVTVADEARSLGCPDVTIIGADVSKVQDCKQFVDETLNYFGRLDHLVNNAGIFSGKLVVIEDFHEVSEYTPVMASKAAVINFFECLRMEVGWRIGITIVTPGFIKTDLASRAMEHEAILRKIPMGSARKCATAIVESACRGDKYVTDPSWVKVLFPWKVLFPEVVDFAIRFILELSQNSSIMKANLHLSRIPELKTCNME
ncbi:11-beta-hydroxysteroid dehydrogenase-like 2 isoform X4 [Cajanus cajan]|uniref:11-beta-hydroxysteroid dehydrogenase-like 2 isoform X4 n=1 Tax=Cajanus cajan TaxID=3821 RepID=UPI0010FB1D39|nr:11-beta-hydroxysteroid dehydrogenase-like 2 isoform X4 [Cajanus cajan]